MNGSRVRLAVWQVRSTGPVRVTAASVQLERELEDWIARDPSLAVEGLEVVGRQISLEGGRLDLLGVDPQGLWTIVEIKRGRLYRDTVARRVFGSLARGKPKTPRIKRKEADVRKLIVQEWMTLDGVVQAPGMKDEDRSGGFEHGGWSLPYFEDASMKWVVDTLNEAGGFVLGRRTYELFARHWPNASEEEQPMAQPLNSKPKFVATKTLDEPLDWEHSTVLHGDVAKAVATLKEEDGGDLLVIGSAELVKTLVDHDLVDEYRLMIDPLVVGGGKRLFPEDGALNELKLLDSETTATGAILATYAATKA